MNKIIYRNICKASVLCISLCTLFSCRNNDNKNDHIMAEQLFLKSTRLIEVYTDSIRDVQDSMSFHRMRNEFDDKLAKINFQFPPDTDLKLTQEENDSLIRMLQKLIKVTKEKEKFLLHGDSISTIMPDSNSFNISGTQSAIPKPALPVHNQVTTSNNAGDSESKSAPSEEQSTVSVNQENQ